MENSQLEKISEIKALLASLQGQIDAAKAQLAELEGVINAAPVAAPVQFADLEPVEISIDDDDFSVAAIPVAATKPAVEEPAPKAVEAPAPVEVPAPVEAPAPAEEPVAEETPVTEGPVAEEEPVAEEPAAVVEEAPAEEPAPVEAPAEEPAPVEAPAEEPAPVEAPVAEPEAPAEPADLPEDDLPEEDLPEEPAPAAQAPAEPAPAPAEPAPAPEPAPAEPEDDPFASFFGGGSDTPAVETINDAGKKKVRKTIKEAAEDRRPWKFAVPGTPVKNIISAISLNDRVLFVNSLFKGDHAAFQATLAALNEMASFEQAEAYVEQTFPEWDLDSDQVYRFMMAVRRKLK